MKFIDHFAVAKPCNSLGVILKKRGKWEESIIALKRSLKIREINLGIKKEMKKIE